MTSCDDGVEMVREFHLAFDCVVTPSPWMPELSLSDRQLMRKYSHRLLAIAHDLKQQAKTANAAGRGNLGLLLIRLQLHVEENGELAQAWVDQDIVAALDALTDISYVVDGTYLTHGLDRVKVGADAEVHRSNMTKLGDDGRPIFSTAGRVEKGPRYERPELSVLLTEDELRGAVRQNGDST